MKTVDEARQLAQNHGEPGKAVGQDSSSYYWI